MSVRTAAPRVLVAFYSRTGVTEAIAESIAHGAREAGADGRLRRAREFVADGLMARSPGWREAADTMNARHPVPIEADAEWADAIVFGSPSRFTPALHAAVLLVVAIPADARSLQLMASNSRRPARRDSH